MPKFKHLLVAAAVLLTVVAAPRPGYAQTVPTKTPYVQSATINMAEGADTGSVKFNFGLSQEIPTGKRLVIQFVSGRAKLPVGQMAEFSIQTEEYFGTTDTKQLPTYVSNYFGVGNLVRSTRDWFIFSQPTLILGKAGTTVTLTMTRSSTAGRADGTVTINGYLESLQ